ncbi:hypothetical protein ACFPJ4_12265 [Lysinimonas soli]|uniref:Nuclear transport factor 2 family protein n=1 Tax=Lysinimonas soli TaxID=1074233 RepID=A0ABW0NRE5_9MICO
MSNAGTTATDSDRDAGALVEKWVELWNGDYSLAAQIISDGNRVHAAMFDGGDGSAVGGVSGMVDFVTQLRSLLPDLVSSVEVGPIIDILRVADQQAVEYWLNADTLGLVTQLQLGAG